MDTWFTNETFTHKVLDEGLDVIGMVKDCRGGFTPYNLMGKLSNMIHPQMYLPAVKDITLICYYHISETMEIFIYI